VKYPYIYPANKQLISEDLCIDELPAIKIRGKRLSDSREGWFYFSAVKGSYHSILPEWIREGDEVEFFEPLADGTLRSLTLPGVELAGGSVSGLLLERGNILLFSNITGVHQSFYLSKPGEFHDLHEIVVDTVYKEQSCPQCGSEMVFHYRHATPTKTYSKCLSCEYDWQGKVQSELRNAAQELEHHPHLRELLADSEERTLP
jgi:hypothetical protein